VISLEMVEVLTGAAALLRLNGSLAKNKKRKKHIEKENGQPVHIRFPKRF